MRNDKLRVHAVVIAHEEWRLLVVSLLHNRRHLARLEAYVAHSFLGIHGFLAGLPLNMTANAVLVVQHVIVEAHALLHLVLVLQSVA